MNLCPEARRLIAEIERYRRELIERRINEVVATYQQALMSGLPLIPTERMWRTEARKHS